MSIESRQKDFAKLLVKHFWDVSKHDWDWPIPTGMKKFKGWPENLDTENYELVAVGPDYITWKVGGDWQEQALVSLEKRVGSNTLWWRGFDYHKEQTAKENRAALEKIKQLGEIEKLDEDALVMPPKEAFDALRADGDHINHIGSSLLVSSVIYDGWWISPSGQSYGPFNVTHVQYAMQHPDLFGLDQEIQDVFQQEYIPDTDDCKGDFDPTRYLLDKGWISIRDWGGGHGLYIQSH